MGDEEDQEPSLRVVSSQTTEELLRRQMLDRLASREFNAPSFADVLERREFLFQHSLQVPRARSVKDAVSRAKRNIVRMLTAHRIPVEVLDVEKLRGWSDRIAMNLGLVPYMADTDRSELPHENVARHLEAFTYYMLGLTHCLTREQLEKELEERYHIRVENSDVIRLLVHEINLGRWCPLIVGLPNHHKPYNPLFVALYGERPMPVEVLRLFHAFAR